MTTIRGAEVRLWADLESQPFILDRDLLDANPGSELSPPASHWDEITCDVLSADWSRGATTPLGPLTTVDAGRMRVSIYDPDRQFDPSNEGSPIYREVRIGMAMRVTVEGVSAWTGTLDAWESDLGERTSTLSAIDAIGTLASRVIPDNTALGAGTTAVQANAVLDLAGWPADLRSFTGTTAATRSAVTIGGSALEVLNSIRLVELGALYGARDGKIGWVGRTEPAPGAPTATINCGGAGLISLTTVFPRGRVRNRVLIAGPITHVYVVSGAEARHNERTVQSSDDELAFVPPGNATASQDWGYFILGKLVEPRPITALGTIIPVGPAQVVPIVCAEWGDRWRVVATDTVPPIDRLVRVLGLSVSLAPDTIEVDAVTEDI